MANENDEEMQQFNGDTPQGRTMWVPWLRSLELALDEWSWAVLQGGGHGHRAGDAHCPEPGAKSGIIERDVAPLP